MVWDPKRIDELKQGAETNIRLIDIDYKLSKLNQFRSWQDSFEGNISGSNSLGFDIYVDQNVISVRTALLRFKLKPFEYYTGKATTIINGPWAGETNGAGWLGSYETDITMSPANDHDHGGAVVADGYHGHFLQEHRHIFNVPAHQHSNQPEIFYDTNPTNVSVYINGVDRTAALGGPFNSDQASLDITPYVTPTGWNEVRFYSNTRGRIFSTYYIELHKR